VSDVKVVSIGDGFVRAECQVDAQAGVEARIARVIATRWSLHRLERQQSTLENVFLRYVNQSAQQQKEAA